MKQAKARNDPSFSLLYLSNTANKNRFTESHNNGRRTVSVHKTDMSSYSNFTPSAEGPEKQCPVHHKPHPLQRCRGFREKLIEESKRILTEHNICFKCCASNKNLARCCETTTKCFECNSDRHPTTLHPGPAPWASEPFHLLTEHGGEKEVSSETVVMSNCTEVCGEGFQRKSFSKICLVTVYPAGSPNQARKCMSYWMTNVISHELTQSFLICST